MAILINEAFQNEAANGVILTIPTKSGDPEISVNVLPGGLPVVQSGKGSVPEIFSLQDAQAKIAPLQSSPSPSPRVCGRGTPMRICFPSFAP